jgi:hypothetical protein
MQLGKTDNRWDFAYSGINDILAALEWCLLDILTSILLYSGWNQLTLCVIVAAVASVASWQLLSGVCFERWLILYPTLVWWIAKPNLLCVVFWLLRHLWTSCLLLNDVCLTCWLLFYSLLVCWIVGPNSLCVVFWPLRHLWHLGYFGMMFAWQGDIYFTLLWFGGLLDPTHFVCYQGCKWNYGILVTLKWCLADTLTFILLHSGLVDFWTPFRYYMLFSKVSLQNMTYFWQ